MKPLELILRAAMAAICCVLLAACGAAKHVPQGQMLLDRVDISVDDKSIKPQELEPFLRQVPNHKIFWLAKLQLGIYNLSGRDSTKWYNRWLQNIGEPPVIYSPQLADMSQRQLRQALVNRGYINAQVGIDSLPRPERRRMSLDYVIRPGEPYRIASLAYNIPDTAIARVVYADTARRALKPGDLFDRNRLDEFRTQITNRLRDQGYYAFNKDDISFTADTVAGSKEIGLTLNIGSRGAEPSPAFDRYVVRKVWFVSDYDPGGDPGGAARQDTVCQKGICVVYGRDRYIAPSILEEKCHIQPGAPYNASAVSRTYEALSQLGILKYINIEMRPAGQDGAVRELDAYVLISRNSKQGVTFELDGTHSEGDLGFGASVIYQHRNLAKRSNLLTVKLRGAYEHLSGNYEGLVNNRYTEYAGEVGITFPKLQAPFLSSSYKKRRIGSTEFAVSFNYQERPEYTRVIGGAAWKYKWTHRRRQTATRQTADLVDINYVRLPKSTINFLDEIAPSNPLLRYSYEDHFIMRMGYSFYRTNKRQPGISARNSYQPSITTVRGSAEMAGNLLYAMSTITGQHRHDGAYKIFGIQYAQYVKAEADYTRLLNISPRSGFVFHVGGGVAVPYGNSSMVPFEKRFYAGGANSVRGWGVRTLGPGCYDSKNSVIDFINQCGDIALNLNVEYRIKLFWVFEGALFVDAGNIWTIRDYENQPGGVFKIDKFYKQVAAAYGAGLRCDFTYFLLRFDLGFKAHNPAKGQEPWPLLHPRWGRDTNFHFAVGYPF